MEAGAVVAAGAVVQQRPLAPQLLEEDSKLLKALSCVPILGAIPSMIQEQTLKKKTELYNDRARLIEVLTVKNHYKVCNIIRSVFEVALVIAAFAFGIIGKGLFVIVASLMTIQVFYLIYSIAYNKEQIVELQIRGFRRGIMIA